MIVSMWYTKNHRKPKFVQIAHSHYHPYAWFGPAYMCNKFTNFLANVARASVIRLFSFLLMRLKYSAVFLRHLVPWPYHLSVKILRRSSQRKPKFLCVKTVSGKVVRHSLAQLTEQKWLVGGNPLYLKFWTKVTALERNSRFSYEVHVRYLISWWVSCCKNLK